MSSNLKRNAGLEGAGKVVDLPRSIRIALDMLGDHYLGRSMLGFSYTIIHPAKGVGSNGFNGLDFDVECIWVG